MTNLNETPFPILSHQYWKMLQRMAINGRGPVGGVLRVDCVLPNLQGQ